MFDFLKRNTTPKDELIIFHEYIVYSTYSEDNKSKIMSIADIFKRFKKKATIPKKWGVYVKSEYNGISYPMFDLDTIEHKETFEKLYSDVPYVLYQSSIDHYWGILGVEKPNIFTDTYWISCNDTDFVNMTKERKHFRLRALYEELNRKPVLIKVSGDISKNFEEFNNKVQSFINNDAMELSILKYKNPQMMLKFDRKRKLEQIDGNIQ